MEKRTIVRKRFNNQFVLRDMFWELRANTVTATKTHTEYKTLMDINMETLTVTRTAIHMATHTDRIHTATKILTATHTDKIHTVIKILTATHTDNKLTLAFQRTAFLLREFNQLQFLELALEPANKFLLQ